MVLLATFGSFSFKIKHQSNLRPNYIHSYCPPTTVLFISPSKEFKETYLRRSWFLKKWRKFNLERYESSSSLTRIQRYKSFSSTQAFLYFFSSNLFISPLGTSQEHFMLVRSRFGFVGGKLGAAFKRTAGTVVSHWKSQKETTIVLSCQDYGS